MVFKFSCAVFLLSVLFLSAQAKQAGKQESTEHGKGSFCLQMLLKIFLVVFNTFETLFTGSFYETYVCMRSFFLFFTIRHYLFVVNDERIT